MSRRAAMACASSAALLGMPSAAPAAEPWGGPSTAYDTDEAIAEPAVAVDERGYALAAFVRRSGVQRRLLGVRRTPSRGFGTSFLLQPPVARLDSPQLEFDGNRRAFVAFRRDLDGALRVGAATVAPDGDRGRPTVFTGVAGPPGPPRFVDPPFDRPVLTWTGASGNVYATPASSSGAFSGMARFDLDAVARDIQTAAEPRGGVLVAHVTRVDGGDRRRVVVARRIPGTARYSVTPVSDPGAPSQISVAVTKRGRAVVTWCETAGSDRRMLVAERPAGASSFGTPRPLEHGPQGCPELTLTAAGDGDVAATWRAGGDVFHGTVGRPAERVSRPGTTVTAHRVRSDGRGGVTVALIEAVGSSPSGVVRARAVTRRGLLGRLQRLSANGERARSLALGVGERGDAVAVWVTADRRRLRSARRPQ